MAVPFRNLQGGNPYQGLANTFENVSSRVGATFMSYGEARRRRNEERDRLKADRDKSMVDAIVKLVPAAVGYEQQKDAFEYKKEQDQLDREFRQEKFESEKADRKSLFEETVRGRKVAEKSAEDTRAYQTKMFDENVRRTQVAENLSEKTLEFQTKKFDAILEENKENRSFRQWQQENAANERRLNAEHRARQDKYAQDNLNLKKATPLEQSNMANSMAININKSKAQRYSNLYDKYRIWAGMGSLDGKIPPAINSPNVDSEGNPKMGFADWVEDGVNGLGLPEGYVSGLLTETTYEDVLARHNITLPAGTPTPEVATDEEDDLTVINKVIEENTPKDEPPPAVVNEPQSVLENPPPVAEGPSVMQNRSALASMRNIPTEAILKAYPEANEIQRGYFSQVLNERGVELPNVEEEVVKEEEIEGTKMMVNTPVLNVREGPSTKNRKSGSMLSGVTVIVLETRGGWSRIKTMNDNQGYGQLSASDSGAKEEWVWSKSLIPIK